MNGTFLTGAAELKNIFSAPLEAVIDADVSLSQKIADFIIRYGFESNANSEENAASGDERQHIGKLKMVSFSYENGDRQKQVFSFPVLSLVQLPMLKIREAELDMQVKLFSVRQEQEPPNLKAGNEDEDIKDEPSAFKAYLAPNGKNVSDAMSSNLNVKLKMTESDLPGGVLNLLSLLNELNTIKNINPKENEQAN